MSKTLSMHEHQAHIPGKEELETCPGPYLFLASADYLDLDALPLDGALKETLNGAQHTKAQFRAPAGRIQKVTVDGTQGLVHGRGLARFLESLGTRLLVLRRGDAGGLTCEIAPLWGPSGQARSRLRAPARNAAPDMELPGGVSFHPERARALLDRLQKGLFDEDPRDLYRRARELSITPGFETMLFPGQVKFDPLPYQVEAARTVIRRLNGRAMLCDEVGLGKTIEAGLVLLEYFLRGMATRVLILCPPGLMEQWREEMTQKFGLDFLTPSDPEFVSQADPWGSCERVIASLATARQKGIREAIWQVPYDMVIIDEAHHLKNRNSANWTLASRIKTRYLLLLTATPFQNRLEELYNLVSLVKPGLLGTPRQFGRRFRLRGATLSPQQIADLHSLLAEVMVRNRRSDTRAVITRRHAETVKVVPSPAEKRLYEEISARVRAAGRSASPAERLTLKTLQKLAGSSPAAVLPALRRLGWRDLADLATRAAADDLTGKERALLSLLHATRDKVIVFASYTETVNMLERLLTTAGHTVVTYAGSMTKAQKDAAVRRFAQEARVFLSTEAGGEGRNLQFCNRMINYDLPWNPMRIEQRLGRIHRVGQTRDVYVHNLCTEGSLEEQLLELLDRKLGLFELVVGEIDLILGDVLEERDFEEMVFDMWLASSDTGEFAALLDQLGQAMADAKRRYVDARRLQDAALPAAT